jgi:NAD(P)-dependent dehydrogenase (short-subunit alcohol dehydrogenase family)
MKTFLSIGTGPGNGLATAERFAREGFRVVLSARNVAKTQALAERLKAAGHSVEVRAVDSANPASIAALIADVEKQFGGIDVLHYNAASMREAPLDQQPAATFNDDLAVNVGGALVAAQAVAPGMTKRGAGSILLTGGGLALYPNAGYVSLSIGKAGIRALALALFDSLKEKGIHIATVTVAAFVAPGTKEADGVGEQFWQLQNQPKAAWTLETVYTA